MRRFLFPIILMIVVVAFFTGMAMINAENPVKKIHTVTSEIHTVNPHSRVEIHTVNPHSNLTPTEYPICRIITGFPEGTVNLRSGSGLSFGSIAILHENDMLQYLGFQENGFLKVVRLSDNKTGFVRDLYINCTDG